MHNAQRAAPCKNLKDVPSPIYFALVAVIGLAGLLLRVADLEAIPAGLHFDQAANGLLALQIVAGARPVFFPSYTGREALFMYVIAGLFRLLGPNLLALRLAGALCGAATIVALVFLGSALFGRRVGLLASAFLAGLYWHLHVSRLAERTIMVPLVDVLALLALWYAFRRRSPWLAALGGALVGLQLYTYPSSRFFVVAVVGIGVVELGILLLGRARKASSFASPSGRGRPRAGEGVAPHGPSTTVTSRRGLPHPNPLPEGEGTGRGPGLAKDGGRGPLALAAVAAIAAAIVVLPLARYFRANPGDFLGRADQVAIWNVGGSGVGSALATSVAETLGMFIFQGDQDWKYNLAGQPVFDPLMAALFVGGLILALARIRERGARVCLIWGWCMLVPGFLSVDAPQFMRTLGAAPAAVLLAAVGLDALVVRLRTMSPAARRLAPALWGWPVIVGIVTAYRYFAVWGPSPAAYLALEGDVTAAASILKEQAPKYATTFVASRYDADPTLYFLAGDQASRARWFDGQAALPLPVAGSGPTLYVLPRTATNAAWYRSLPDSSLVAKVIAPDTGPAVEAFALDSSVSLAGFELVPPAGEAATSFGGVARLVGFNVPKSARQGEIISPTFVWQVESAPPAPLKFFVHLADPSGQTWSQYDEEMYPTSEWVAGQTLLVRYPLKVPDDAAPETYHLQIGIERSDGTALPALSATNRPAGSFWQSPSLAVARSVNPPNLAALDVGHRMNVQFGNVARLVGADVPATRVQDGDNIDFTLFWQVTDRVPAGVNAVVQAVNRSGAVVARRSQPPSNGFWPPTDWRSGDVVVDRERLLIPAGTPSGRLSLTVGMGDAPDHALIPVGQTQPTVAVASLDVQSRPRAVVTTSASHPMTATFASPLRLIGYDLQPTSARPGEAIQLRLYWQADQPLDRSWTVFTHVLDAQSQIHAQEDSIPDHGNQPTTTWVPGETIVDSHTLVVQPGTAPGAEHIEIGLYDAASGARLKTAAGDDRVLLDTPVKVLP
jgi:hypothetical protein